MRYQRDLRTSLYKGCRDNRYFSSEVEFSSRSRPLHASLNPLCISLFSSLRPPVSQLSFCLSINLETFHRTMPFPSTWTVRLEGTFLVGNDGLGHSFRFDLNNVLDYDSTTGSFKWGSGGFASKARRNSVELQPGTSRLSAVFGSERVFVDLSTHLRLDRNGALVYS
jgi:hypothetical protein